MKKSILSVIIAAVLIAVVVGVVVLQEHNRDTSGYTPITNVSELVDCSNEFAFDMYQELIDGEENVFFSPYSITTALSMTYEGARGQTADEMAEGVRKLMNADIGLSVTGIAGPAGATREKPVGLFYIGISSALGTKAVEHVFGRDRLQNKKSAAEAALIMLREHLVRERGNNWR